MYSATFAVGNLAFVFSGHNLSARPRTRILVNDDARGLIQHIWPTGSVQTWPPRRTLQSLEQLR